MAEDEDETGGELPPQAMLRAGLYRLLAALLDAAPGDQELGDIKDLTGDPTPLGQAIADLAAKARVTDARALAQEFQDLFGQGHGAEHPGEVSPFASFYLTGGMLDEPPARLRLDMQRLGIERDPEVGEPEDHAASILEMMAGLIDGTLGEPLPIAEQKAIYEAHLAAWMPDFFRNLEAAQSADFYAAVATVGTSFLQIEDETFMML